MNFDKIISEIREGYDNMPTPSDSSKFYYKMVSLSLTEKPYTGMPKHTVLSYVKYWLALHEKERPVIIKRRPNYNYFTVRYAYTVVLGKLHLLKQMLEDIVNNPGYWKMPKSTEPEWIKISKQERPL